LFTVDAGMLRAVDDKSRLSGCGELTAGAGAGETI
jgi:hypothetical protein